MDQRLGVFGHEGIQPSVDERADALGEPIECAEGGQLAPSAHQLFDRDVDQVGGEVMKGGGGMGS